MIASLESLETLDGYRRYFMDTDLWRPQVQDVCRRHGLLPCQQIRAGLAGTYPTFIVEDRWVVKFFGRLFDGQQSYEMEHQVGHLLPSDLIVHVPAILYSGALEAANTSWPWPYLIFEFIHGTSIGEVYGQVAIEDKLELARLIGKATRQLQNLQLDGVSLFRTGQETYVHFLQSQRERCLANHQEWRSLPDQLLGQIGAYVLPVDALVDCRFPFGLIHADITRDHILGRLEAGRWTTLGLIDSGDARAGNIFYDLAALHLDLFRYDKRLLRAYLEAYGLPDDLQFPHLAMSGALLHQFNVLEGLLDALPQARFVASLGDLAKMIWDIQA
jgi:Ser/Thr protein kinase RdoA (MazF antagonist)